ncbi:hypothetical protein G5714_024096 [Onychostoma macrolepis]|uniref:Ovochymase 2 n=1 Tax=Onychostoma macrolepis TaxID=369639 RepID=A0A7J6BJ15_9TELE|nr:hypothetical protein G5714_024096 [Onychostoma macrolepis]
MKNSFYHLQVSLRIRGSHFCAAAILTEHWLLTAAHCFASVSTDFLHKIEAVAGDLNQTKVDRGEQNFQVKSIKFHEKYQRSSPMSYDIALLEIKGRIHFGDFIKPVCLPYPGERFPPKTMCVVGGWGRITEKGPLSSVLQEVQLNLLEQNKCKHVLQTLRPGQKTFTVLCAGPERGGRDACQGDSGGPLLCPRADGRWVAVGVTSWGKGCGRSWNNNKIKPSSRRGSPGVFTDVLMFLSWIKSNLRKELNIVADRSLCGVPDGVVPGSEGIIRNPAHPGQSYNNNEMCLWSIQVPTREHILLEFLEFDLENDTQCYSDHLTVYVDEDRRIGRFCGGQPPSLILIAGSHSIIVQFGSDVSSTGAGFSIQFSGVDKDYSFGAECGTVVLLQPKGAVQSPAYPQAYSNNTLCRWVIYAPEGHIVKLDFDDFDLEESENCKYDSLTVFGDIDGKDEIDLRETAFEDQGEEADDDSRVLSPHLQAAPYGMPDIFATSGLDTPRTTEDDGKLSWHVNISLGAGYECSGAIIQSQWILTDAHCVYKLEEQHLRFLSVTAGGSKKQICDVIGVLVHPHYSPFSLDYNVALLKLSSPLNLSESTQPVCLPSAGQEIPPSLHCWAPAWTSQMSGHGQCRPVRLKISVLERAVCEQHHRTTLTPTMLCVGLSSGESCMTHWTAGPLVCLTNTSGVVLMGVKSWGEPCGGIQKPAVYSSVPAIMHWISQHLDME